MREVIERLADHQPSRAVLRELVGPTATGIDATRQHELPRRRRARHASVERVELTLHGEARAGAASAIVPLLRSDLPTVLWWPGAPDPSPDGPLARLAALADRVVTEVDRDDDAAAALRDPGRLGVGGRRPCRHRPGVGRDHRLAPADRPGGGRRGAGAACAAAPASAVVAHPGARPSAKALLMAGWLRERRRGRRSTVTLEQRPGDGDELVAVELAGRARGAASSSSALPGRGAAAVCVTEPDGTERAARAAPAPPPTARGCWPASWSCSGATGPSSGPCRARAA